MSALEKRSVTSSLIFKFPDDDESQRPQLALFRRSDKVRTYQNKYGLISGSIEPSDPTPLSCAWRELREETGLASPPLRLLRRGRPFSFRDESVGREWTVHPFMFKLEAARAGDITIDWEHSGYAWFDPADAAGRGGDGEGDGDDGLEGVPRLAQSVRSVWFEMELGARAGGVLAAGLRELRGDYESGARELAAKAMRIYAATAAALAEREHGSGDEEQNDEARRDAWWRGVRLAGWHLWKNGRESMGAAVANLVLAVLAVLEGEFRAAPSLAECARGAIARVCGASELSGRRIRESFHAVLGQVPPAPPQGPAEIRILTLSSSSMVRACLADALADPLGGRPLDIRVLESRPLFEGVKAARVLAALCKPPSRSTVTVYTDASAAVAARGVHLVLLGADAIDGSANVSNKTGSLPAVLAARHVAPGGRVVVVSEMAKVLPFDAPDEERSNVEEMASSWQEPDGERGFAVESILFEWVDAALVDHFATERGVLTAAEISQRADEIKQGADRFFVDI
ncbi:Translation initiation factor eIF-2B subunit alpha [Escovopsis weberi]|uniref:Translation initiation factor eIF-2B subunit alpha n=1 Tax=Escovopsis weberi TaxID=150374 RepID=A0A0M8N6L6_ESCWE|nr:Translation initiation factor eIF-2B subunit alpha [Escovopsis weberi]